MPIQQPPRPKRRTLRLQGYDYRASGAYYVTICTAERRPIFGIVRQGKVYLNDLGQLARSCWMQIERIRSDVSLDAFIVMPNHIHGILLMAGAAESANTPIPERRLAAGSLGAILAQYKSIVTKHGKTLAPAAPRPMWQRNYFDHIIRSEAALEKIRRYIVENPARWEDDEFFIA